MSVAIIFVSVFLSILLCRAEIPEMLEKKQFRELWAFSILLFIGIALIVLKGLNVKIWNPSDSVEWVFSPLRKLLESMLKQV